MARQKRHPKMPVWIWRLQPGILSWKEKHFLAYLWWTGPAGAHSWNYRLEKMFRCSRSTVQRRLRKFKKLQLIHIGHAGDRGRTIWANPYYSHKVWIEKTLVCELCPGVSKVTPINNAQQKNSYTERYSSAGAQKDSPKRPAMETIKASNAGGLGGSKPHGKDLLENYPEHGYNVKNLESELQEIVAQAEAARERRKRERELK